MTNLELARNNPPEIYKHPSEVLSDKTLSRSDKIDILHRWAYDELEKAVADEENMPDKTHEESNLLDEIMRSLIELDDKRSEKYDTSK